MAIAITIDMTLTGEANISKRNFAKIKRGIYRVVAEYWMKRLRRKHFTRAGAREYGYTPRSGEAAGRGGKAFWRSYTGRKQRKFGHTLPLVWSGELRRQTGDSRVTATQKGSTVYIKGRALNLRLRNSQINMRREMTTVSSGERVELIRLAQKKLIADLKQLPTKRIRTR